MKFKVGDRVQIAQIKNLADISQINPDYLIGKIGTIIDIHFEDNADKYPIEILFDDVIAKESGNELWAENELEYENQKNIYQDALNWFNKRTGYDFMKLIEDEKYRKEFYEKVKSKN